MGISKEYKKGPFGSAGGRNPEEKGVHPPPLPLNPVLYVYFDYMGVRNQEKRLGWENHVSKAREKGDLHNSFRWDEADAKFRSYIFLCLGAEGQRQVEQKRPGLDFYTVTTRDLIITLEDIFVTIRIVVFERYSFVGRKQKKIENLEQLHADLVELASRSDCGDREDEWVRDTLTAHIHNEKLA